MFPFLRRFTSTFAIWTVALLCLFSFAMMLWAARTDSAIDDELAHIPAGYGYVHNLDYRLNPEHPPLVKALAMLPVLFLNPTFPTNNAAWTTAVNGEWDMGRAFLYGTTNVTTLSGAVLAQPINNANAIIQWARIMPILLTILTIIFVFLLARSLLGDLWALLPTALFALDPTVLAHGHYVTTDMGATFGVVFATYFFLRFLEKHSSSSLLSHNSYLLALLFAGLAFGVAQITKFSTPFVMPVFLFVVFVLWLREIILQRPGFKKAIARGWRALWPVLAIFAIGYMLIVYPVYALFTARYPIAKQVSDTTAILTSFANGPTPAGQMCAPMRCLANLDIWAAHSPVLRPFAEYLLGVLMVFQRADAGNTIYFLGHVVNSGGWIYFPVLYILKEPLPSLIIVFIALALTLWGLVKNFPARSSSHSRSRSRSRFSDYLGLHFAEFTLASFVVLYLAFAMHSQLNLGIRYILPVFPFIFILAAGVWKNWLTSFDLAGFFARDFLTNLRDTLFSIGAKYALLVALVLWLACETAFAAPYFLSYYNEFAGGTAGGYHYATDSNYDWGQDLLRLQAWVNQYQQCVDGNFYDSHQAWCTAGVQPTDQVAVDYFGGGDPHYYLGGREVNWSPSKGNPAEQGIHWLAVSINQLEGATQPLAAGQARNPANEYAWLTALRPPAPGMGNVPTPDYRVGTTLFIYKL